VNAEWYLQTMMKSVKTTVVTFILGHLDIYKYRMYRLDIHGAYVNVCYQHEILLSMNCSFRLTIKVYSKNTIKLKTKHTALPEQFQNKTYCTARTVLKFNNNRRNRGKMDTPNTDKHD
jgi:hypothetical protein